MRESHEFIPLKMASKMPSVYLPVLVLRLERHQGAILAARQDVLWGRAVDLLQLVASFLPLAAVCSRTRRENVFAGPVRTHRPGKAGAWRRTSEVSVGEDAEERQGVAVHSVVGV